MIEGQNYGTSILNSDVDYSYIAPLLTSAPPIPFNSDIILSILEFLGPTS